MRAAVNGVRERFPNLTQAGISNRRSMPRQEPIQVAKPFTEFWAKGTGVSKIGNRFLTLFSVSRLHRRFAEEDPLAADRLATSGEGRPRSQRREPESRPATRPWARVRNGKPCGVPFGSSLRFCQKSLPYHHLPAFCDLVIGRGGRLECCRLMCAIPFNHLAVPGRGESLRACTKTHGIPGIRPICGA